MRKKRRRKSWPNYPSVDEDEEEKEEVEEAEIPCRLGNSGDLGVVPQQKKMEVGIRKIPRGEEEEEEEEDDYEEKARGPEACLRGVRKSSHVSFDLRRRAKLSEENEGRIRRSSRRRKRRTPRRMMAKMMMTMVMVETKIVKRARG